MFGGSENSITFTENLKARVMSAIKITKNEAVAKLQGSGHFFGATYQKKNGEVTKIIGRFGVSKFVKGTGSSSPKVWTVWDTSRERYTSLIPDNIIDITYQGETFELL